ncbi:MAG TPA: NADH-ubiquinone oxidoreductase-F iron-sulfur binding region domain-containing protein [Rugosimonospora sp.]|nr:NADH-ubiquinone oxidoreductase-F iron-sulfur binding region domain-containing protein [Rugosimonospora sp.]
MSGGNVPAVQRIGPPRLTAGFSRFRRLDLRAHRAVHGDLRPLTLGELVALAEAMKLRGRGGAGFPFARKVRAVVDSARQRDADRIIVVNATEGEPASWKDKIMLLRAPHLILDGAAIAAAALQAAEIVIGVEESKVGTESMIRALAERRMPAPTRLVTMPARFISGEGGALVRGINGELPIPPGRKVRASDYGVDGLPTLLSNAETYAQLAVAARLGPAGYAAVGTAEEPGTVMLTIGGSAGYPSVVEAPAGVPLKEVLRMCRAPIGAGVLVGGFHGKWISAEAAETASLSWEGMKAVGGGLGAGIILPLGDGTCPLGEATRVVHYLAGQSAGQCGPCRLGLPDVARAFASLADGSGGSSAMDAVRVATATVRGRGACSHPDGTAKFVLSALETFTEDIDAHLRRDGCGRPVKGVLPLPAEEAESGSRLMVDWARCDGHGLCAVAVPELIRLDGNGYPSFPDTPVPVWLEAEARKAVSICPALALRLAPVGQQHGGGGKPPSRDERKKPARR